MHSLTAVFTCVFFYNVFISWCCDAEYSGSLRLVNVVFRHGQRTPADTYPNDPHINFDFHPFGWGQLTTDGKLQQYQLGRFLRNRYGNFLGDSFSTELLRVQSTDVDRTIMSAQIVCAGLFPPIGDQMWNPDLQWQPIPVHSQPLDQDTLLLVRTPCPRYGEALNEVQGSHPVKDYLHSLNDLYRVLSNYTGMPIINPDDVQSLYSTLLAEEQFNLSLPQWTREFFPEKLAAVTAFSFTLNAYNNELKKLKGGPLLKKILQDIKDKVEEPESKRKMFMYAGHDSTVANIMLALNVWEVQIPVYNIMAMIELHEINNEYGLKVFLRNSTEHNPYLLTIPGCDDFCSLKKVIQLSTNVLPEDLKKECISHDPNYIPPPPSGP